MMPRLLRAFAVIIALAGALDPAITSNRTVRPDVAIVAIDPVRDSALAQRVARTLAGSFTVTSAPFAAAGATVVVGSQLPEARGELATPAFAVIPDRDSPAAVIEAVRAPAWSPLGGRVPVNAKVRIIRGMSGGATVNLSADGVAVGSQAHGDVYSDDQATTFGMEFTPARPGVTALHLGAIISRGPRRGDSSVADIAVDVREHKWSVLFYDPRPSWLSTFVRRAVESDDRFTVTSRVVTSKNISTDAGRPPGALDDESALDAFDAVVVGAPDGLTDRDVGGLERFLRRRGGSVLFLLDQFAAGPWQRLADAGKWNESGSVKLTDVAEQPGMNQLKASEFAWPARLPAGAEAIASTEPDSELDRSPRHPVIWRSPVGAGQLVVSGALDAWRYRDSSVSRFDAFWRNTIASAAEIAIAPVTVTIANSVVVPGEDVAVSVSVRSASLRPLPVHATVTAALESESGATSVPVTLWPGDSPGELSGSFRAPATTGAYRIAVTADGHRATVPLVVALVAAHATADASDLLAAWSVAHGGRAVAVSQLDQLAPALRAAITPIPRRERWHPFRSAWWLLPFAFALSGEWWLRRRRGLA